MRAAPIALSPYEPKATVTPRVATDTFKGFFLMVCHFLYLTFLGNNILFIENIALIYPNFDPNSAVRHYRFSESIVNIGTQGLERNTTKLAIFRATHGSTTETTSQKNAYPEHIAVSHHFLKHLFNKTSKR